MKKRETTYLILLLIIVFIGGMSVTCLASGFSELEAVFQNVEEGSSGLIKKIFMISGLVSTGFFAVSMHAGFSKIIGVVVGASLFAALSMILNICFNLAV
jgi:hypothetical protein